ncbi:unnamed protein product, partial [Amoebophrya sp. A25]
DDSSSFNRRERSAFPLRRRNVRGFGEIFYSSDKSVPVDQETGAPTTPGSCISDPTTTNRSRMTESTETP